MLEQYFAVCSSAIEHHGGTVGKYIGDAVMAVWGAPQAREDDAERAVRAALALASAVAALGERLGTELSARAGVLTGKAAVRVGAVHEGMVIGDSVNTAARIQSIADPGGVLVDDATRRAAQAAIAFEEVGLHSLKGKAEPVRLWRARRVVANLGGAGRMEGIEPPLAGRDAQLRALIDAFEATAQDGRARLAAIVGGAGVGKSRLAWELEKYVDGLARHRALAPRPLPRLRRRGRVLGAGRDGQVACADHRGRGRRERARQARRDGCPPRARSRRADAGRAAARRAAGPRAPTGLRPGRPVLGLAAVLRAPGRRGAGDAGLRGPPARRRRPARLRRLPARMVGAAADLHRRPRAPRGGRAPAGVGLRTRRRYLAGARAAGRRRDGRRSSTGSSVDPPPPRCARRSATGRRACRSTRWR